MIGEQLFHFFNTGTNKQSTEFSSTGNGVTLYYTEPQAERMPGVEGRSCSQRKIFVLIVFSSEYYRLQAGGIFVGKKFRLEHRS